MDIILCIAKTKQNTPNLQSAQYGPCTWRPKDFAFEIRKQKSENDAFAVFLRLFIENEKNYIYKNLGAPNFCAGAPKKKS